MFPSLTETIIAGLSLTASGLVVVQSNGWSEPCCPKSLCVQYRPADRNQFCRIPNFAASYKKASPIQIVFVMPSNQGCLLVLNSVTQAESKKIGRRYDLVLVKSSDFGIGKDGKKRG